MYMYMYMYIYISLSLYIWQILICLSIIKICVGHCAARVSGGPRGGAPRVAGGATAPWVAGGLRGGSPPGKAHTYIAFNFFRHKTSQIRASDANHPNLTPVSDAQCCQRGAA